MTDLSTEYNISVDITENDTITANIGSEVEVDLNAQLLYVKSGQKEIKDYVDDVAKPEIDNYVENVVKPYGEEAETYASNASISANNAHNSELNAKTSEDNALISESNAEDYKDRCEFIYERLGTAIKIRGRVDTIDDLPETGNLDGDAYLVGEEGLGSYPEYYWYQDHWEFLGTSGGGGTWGTITGILSNQTDLNNALNSCVHKTGDESISGTKTFKDIIKSETETGDTAIVWKELDEYKDKSINYTVKPSYNHNYYCNNIVDKYGKKISYDQTIYEASGNVIRQHWIRTKTTGTEVSVRYIIARMSANGNASVETVAPFQDTTTSTQIDTVGARNTKLTNYRTSIDQNVIDSNKQAKLTVGTGINITENNVISVSDDVATKTELNTGLNNKANTDLSNINKSDLVYLSMPNYANASSRSADAQYTETSNGWLMIYPTNTNGESKFTLTIGGKNYPFYQGYYGSDYEHITNGFIPIPKGVEYSFTASNVAVNFIPCIGG